MKPGRSTVRQTKNSKEHTIWISCNILQRNLAFLALWNKLQCLSYCVWVQLQEPYFFPSSSWLAKPCHLSEMSTCWIRKHGKWYIYIYYIVHSSDKKYYSCVCECMYSSCIHIYILCIILYIVLYINICISRYYNIYIYTL